MKHITVGCDPEFFVKQDDNFINALGLVEGTKNNPFPVERGAVQVDGMALEFNISPANSSDEFVWNIEKVLEQLRMMIPSNLEFAMVPVAKFDKKYFEEQPAESKELGCEPDYNGWTGDVNKKPNNKVTFRTASGHVHIGYEGDKTYEDQCNLAKQLDFYLGLPSIIYDKDKKRRELYGKAGAFRPKPYGLEYRTLSNAWLLNRERMIWVFEQTVRACQDYFKGKRLFEKYGDIQTIINNSDKRTARDLIKKEGLVCPI